MSVLNVTFPSGVSTYNVITAPFAGEEIFFSGVSMYKIVDSCYADYALTYLNAYGGWDVFAFPIGKRTDNFTQFDYYRDRYRPNNYSISTKQRARQITEITPTWELTTGWLTDEQAAKFAYHLVPSSQLYLRDLRHLDPIDQIEGEVVVIDKKVEYKNKRYSNDLVNYKITVQLASDICRR